jgi:hypothetical protein
MKKHRLEAIFMGAFDELIVGFVGFLEGISVD